MLPDDPDFGTKVLQNAFALWFKPELDRRREQGEVPSDYRLLAMQVVLHVDRSPEVRFNEQVRGQMSVERADDVPPFEKGDSIMASQVKSVTDFHLLEEDGDAAHFSAFVLNGHWHLHFDFRYSASTIERHFNVAKQFLEVADSAISAGTPNAAIENLFAGVELLAKCVLLEAPSTQLRKSKKHRMIASQFNLGTRSGHVPSDWASLLNRLAKLRPAARYGATGLSDETVDALQDLLAQALEMQDFVDLRRPKRAEAAV